MFAIVGLVAHRTSDGGLRMGVRTCPGAESGEEDCRGVSPDRIVGAPATAWIDALFTAAGAGCLPPDQRVLTPQGYRPVAEIDAGEAVVTALGRSRPVVRVRWLEVDEPLFHLRTARGHLLRATGEHPVLARPDEGVPRWTAASTLRPGALVAVFGRTVLADPAGGWRRRPPDGPGASGLATMAREESAVYLGVDWVPLAAADAAPYAGLVYDLDVEQDHSFISDGVVCAACARD